MTDDELVEKMLDAAIYLPNATAEQSMTAALSIARPVIEREALEKAVLSVRELQTPVDDEFEEGYSHGLVDAISVIDALMEQSK